MSRSSSPQPSSPQSSHSRRVLVLCTGNSCRSIMGEAIINSLAGYESFSAGSTPTGVVHPQAIATAERYGLRMRDATGSMLYSSKSWDSFSDATFDIILTVCDNAADEVCPVMPGVSNRLHWSIPDPARVDGSTEEIESAFEEVFLLLMSKINQEFVLNDEQ